MTFSKKLLAGSILASAVALGSAVPASAEIGASVGVANMYLWRGVDLGAGSGLAAVSGDLNFSTEGFYTGIWGSSGDKGAGSEYDLYVGYGYSSGDFSVDFSVWNYVYPSEGPEDVVGGVLQETDMSDLSEAVLSVGYGPVAFTYYENIAGAPDYAYYTLGVSAADFSFTLGTHDDDGDTSSHLDIGYAYNDNLSFTLSQFVDNEPEGDDLKFVVSYSIPLAE